MHVVRLVGSEIELENSSLQHKGPICRRIQSEHGREPEDRVVILPLFLLLA